MKRGASRSVTITRPFSPTEYPQYIAPFAWPSAISASVGAVPSTSATRVSSLKHLAYEDLPSATTIVSSGIRRYSTERVSTKLLGGMMQVSPSWSTRLLVSKCLGSTTVLKALTKIRHSGAARRSYPKLESPKLMTPSRTRRSSNGSIIPSSRAFCLIQRSGLMLMPECNSGPRAVFETRDCKVIS